MGYDDDTEFIRRISAIESSLLDFHPSRVDDFYQQYSDYTNALEVAIRANVLDHSTTALAISLSVKVYHTIESALEVESLSKKLTGSFLDETAVILDHSTTDTLPSPSHIPESTNTIAPYIRPSYEWLTANIHNPYPTPDIRDAIARNSGAARKDIDNWFMDARKRIGWNDARKTHFCNKRSDMIDAAARFYNNDEKLSLTQGAEHALISIMKNVKDLYCDKFNETTLVSKLDAAVKDLTPQIKADAKAERLRQLQMKKVRDPYPSPERSPGPVFLSPSRRDGDVVDTSAQPIFIDNRKRRCTPVEYLDVDQVEDTTRVQRARLNKSSSSNIVSPTSLPSPVTSIDEPLQAVEPFDLSSFFQPTPDVPNRKRRLSESDTSGVPKRPRILPNDTPSRAVPDTSSMLGVLLDAYSTPFDGWFEQDFDLPNVFDDDNDNLTIGFDCELGTLPGVGSGVDVQTESIASEVQALEAFEVMSKVHPSTSTNDSNLGELSSLWFNASSLTNSGKVPVTSGDRTFLPPLPSLDFDLLNHSSGVSCSSSVNDFVTRTYPSSDPDFPWGLLNMHTPLTCDRPFNVPAETPLLVLEDCSGLPIAAMPTSYYENRSTRPPERAAAREEKIMQLLKMKEDALKLELELAIT